MEAVGKNRRWQQSVSVREAGTMLVKFDSYEGRTPCGSLLSLAYDRPFTFRGLDQMVLIMDDIMDTAKYPYPSLGHRYLGKDVYLFQNLQGEQFRDFGQPNPLRHADLSLRVQFRQYASMQGEMAVMGKKKQQKVRFRSTLELMRLIHEYLEKKDEERQSLHRGRKKKAI